jgi:hypothetical protein
MNPNDEHELAAAISRELKALPALAAPATLANRVMGAIESRLRVPWYCRSWETWPVALRAASFLILVALFSGLCFAGWQLSRTEMFLHAMHQTGLWLTRFDLVGSTLGVLLNSVLLMMKKLGTPFIVIGLTAGALGYAAFVSLGTVYFRLAFPKR